MPIFCSCTSSHPEFISGSLFFYFIFFRTEIFSSKKRFSRLPSAENNAQPLRVRSRSLKEIRFFNCVPKAKILKKLFQNVKKQQNVLQLAPCVSGVAFSPGKLSQIHRACKKYRHPEFISGSAPNLIYRFRNEFGMTSFSLSKARHPEFISGSISSVPGSSSE